MVSPWLYNVLLPREPLIRLLRQPALHTILTPWGSTGEAGEREHASGWLAEGADEGVRIV